MKSEHRHDLKTNELRRLAEKMRPFFEEYGNRVLLGLCGVILVAAVVIYWSRSSAASAGDAWTQFSAATNAEDYANVAEEFPGTQVAAWARLLEAQNHLGTGMQSMFTNRAAAISDLKAAEKRFQIILVDSSVPEDVREGALFGMARCLEAKSDSHTDSAIEVYEKLVREFPDSVYTELAQKRIDVLKTQEAKDFYAWFSAQKPKPEDRALPDDLNTLFKATQNDGKTAAGGAESEGQESRVKGPGSRAEKGKSKNSGSRPSALDPRPITKSSSSEKSAKKKEDGPVLKPPVQSEKLDKTNPAKAPKPK